MPEPRRGVRKDGADASPVEVQESSVREERGELSDRIRRVKGETTAKAGVSGWRRAVNTDTAATEKICGKRSNVELEDTE